MPGKKVNKLAQQFLGDIDLGTGATINSTDDGNDLAGSLAPMAYVIDATVGAEAANAIAVGVQVRDAAGDAVSGTFRLLGTAYLADMTVDALSLQCTETGAGAQVNGSNGPRIVFTTDANGAAEVTVTDLSAALAESTFLHLDLVSSDDEGVGARGNCVATLTFA